MGEEETGAKENRLFDILLSSTRLFVFLYLAILALHFLEFREVRELISATGAFLMFAACLAASTIDKLD